MEKARVVLIEDDLEILGFATESVLDAGHSVEGAASEFLVALLVARETEADVFIVDANLTRGRNDNREGEQIVEAIRDANPNAKVVSFSSNGPIAGSDENFPKDQVLDLGHFITAL